MLIRTPRPWAVKDSRVTPESVYLNRRTLLQGLAAGTILAAAPGLAGTARAEADPSAGLYPVAVNPAYAGMPRADVALTAEADATTYNNFYEFGSHKSISQAAQALPLRPWTVTLDGAVDQEQTIDIDDLLARMPLESRIYHHRCVEAWSMTVPYSGFPLKALVDMARPLSSARYVRMETFMDPTVASGQRSPWYPWPYVEGLTIEEATNDLAFIATGLYDKPIPRQNGAPLRLAVPWKYGFKHVKSITRFTFTDKRPVGFWEELQGREYGFWANVNPDVPHPRWSQATERVLGTNDRVPTRPYNGYAEQVAHLYKNMTSEKLFM